MTSFVESFNRGVQNAEQAQNNRREISDVIGQLSRDIVAASGGMIESVALEERRRLDTSVAGAAAALFGESRTKSYYVLAAHHPQDEIPTVDLCEVTIPAGGYPVSIKYYNRDVACADREAFENALAELLEDPRIGEKLHSLMHPAQ